MRWQCNSSRESHKIVPEVMGVKSGHWKDRILSGAQDCAIPLRGNILLELCANRRVLIENHSGVYEYGTQQVGIRYGKDRVLICGTNLILQNINREKLCILGKIQAVTFLEG